MKLIAAIVRPFKLDDVRRAVVDAGIQGLTVTEVIGIRPAAKIEIAVEDALAEQVMEAVCNIARTGRSGDGILWVTDVEQALRIRTGEVAGDAI